MMMEVVGSRDWPDYDSGATDSNCEGGSYDGDRRIYVGS